MAIQQLHLSGSSMTAIYNATDSAIKQLIAINNQVQSSGEQTDTVMQSDAGGKLTQRAFTWNEDFLTIINSMITLNDEVGGMHQLLAAGDLQALSDAGY